MPTSSPRVPDSYVYSSATPQDTSADNTPAISLDGLYQIEAEHSTLEASGSSPRKRKRDESHIRRPANPFILFASNYRKKKENEHKNNRQLSKEAGALWRVMPKDEKDMWKERAAVVKEEHSEKYPGYRYQPRRRVDRRYPCSSGTSQESPGIVFVHDTVSSDRKRVANGKNSCHKKPEQNEESPASPPYLATPFQPGTEHLLCLTTTTMSPPSYYSHEEFDHDILQGLRQSVHPTGPVAAPSSSTSQQLNDLAKKSDTLRLIFPLADQPEQVSAPRIDAGPFKAGSVSYSMFDQHFMSEPCSPEANKQSSSTSEISSEFENAPFFNIFGLPIQADPSEACRATSEPFQLGCDEFFSRNGSSDT